MTSPNGLPQLPAILVAEGLSEGERSEAKRRADAARIAARSKPSTRPDPEVVAKAKRRRFKMDYKLRILREADNASEPGAIGAMLRREGLYCPCSRPGGRNAKLASRTPSARISVAPSPSTTR